MSSVSHRLRVDTEAPAPIYRSKSGVTVKDATRQFAGVKKEKMDMVSDFAAAASTAVAATAPPVVEHPDEKHDSKYGVPTDIVALRRRAHDEHLVQTQPFYGATAAAASSVARLSGGGVKKEVENQLIDARVAAALGQAGHEALAARVYSGEMRSGKDTRPENNPIDNVKALKWNFKLSEKRLAELNRGAQSKQLSGDSEAALVAYKEIDAISVAMNRGLRLDDANPSVWAIRNHFGPGKEQMRGFEILTANDTLAVAVCPSVLCSPELTPKELPTQLIEHQFKGSAAFGHTISPAVMAFHTDTVDIHRGSSRGRPTQTGIKAYFNNKHDPLSRTKGKNGILVEELTPFVVEFKDGFIPTEYEIRSVFYEFDAIVYLFALGLSDEHVEWIIETAMDDSVSNIGLKRWITYVEGTEKGEDGTPEKTRMIEAAAIPSIAMFCNIEALTGRTPFMAMNDGVLTKDNKHGHKMSPLISRYANVLAMMTQTVQLERLEEYNKKYVHPRAAPTTAAAAPSSVPAAHGNNNIELEMVKRELAELKAKYNTALTLFHGVQSCVINLHMKASPEDGSTDKQKVETIKGTSGGCIMASVNSGFQSIAKDMANTCGRCNNPATLCVSHRMITVMNKMKADREHADAFVRRARENARQTAAAAPQAATASVNPYNNPYSNP